jgi:hypothetical protein
VTIATALGSVDPIRGVAELPAAGAIECPFGRPGWPAGMKHRVLIGVATGEVSSPPLTITVVFVLSSGHRGSSLLTRLHSAENRQVRHGDGLPSA